MWSAVDYRRCHRVPRSQIEDAQTIQRSKEKDEKKGNSSKTEHKIFKDWAAVTRTPLKHLDLFRIEVLWKGYVQVNKDYRVWISYILRDREISSDEYVLGIRV